MNREYNIEEIIVRYLQQEITEDELHHLESWLEEDVAHRVCFFELKNISDSSRRSFPISEDMNEASWQKMKARIEIDKDRNKKNPSQITVLNAFFKSSLKYAVIIIIALGMGWGLNEIRKDNNSSSPSDNAIAYNEIQVQKGGRANTLFLSDGSKVVLNAATTLKYPSSFSSHEREVYLDGEAYFEVAKDEKRPFIVKLKRQHITVLGTTFNVASYANETYCKTTLFSGSISLEVFDDKGASMNRMYLKPNQQALSDSQSGSIFLKEVDTTVEKAWIQGIYKFKDEPLSTIVKQLENYYDVNIYLEDEHLEHICYTGSFSFDQGITDILNIINSDKQFKYRQIGKNIFIASK